MIIPSFLRSKPRRGPNPELVVKKINGETTPTQDIPTGKDTKTDGKWRFYR
jgi:hypothetical protein